MHAWLVGTLSRYQRAKGMFGAVGEVCGTADLHCMHLTPYGTANTSACSAPSVCCGRPFTLHAGLPIYIWCTGFCCAFL